MSTIDIGIGHDNNLVVAKLCDVKVIAVALGKAAAKGIDMQKVDAVSGKGCAVKPSARYSTLQDLDAGRHTEIDMFSGALIRMGKELGIPTPYNEFAYHMIKALEEKNDGKFDYTGPNQEMTWAK